MNKTNRSKKWRGLTMKKRVEIWVFSSKLWTGRINKPNVPPFHLEHFYTLPLSKQVILHFQVEKFKQIFLHFFEICHFCLYNSNCLPSFIRNSNSIKFIMKRQKIFACTKLLFVIDLELEKIF